MDERSAQVFLTLAETLHFGRTARRCNLSASAVSRVIQRVEDETGHLLFSRDNRSVQLTPAGRQVHALVAQHTAQWAQLRSALSDQGVGLVGEISLYASVTASYSVLADILPALRRSHPGIELKLHTGDQADGVERVRAGVDDCAVVALPDRLPTGLAFTPLLESPLRLYGPKSGPLAEALAREVAAANEPDWSVIPVVLAEHGLARDRWLARFKSRGVVPSVYAQVAGHEAVVSVVSLGFGVAVVPELVIAHSPVAAAIQALPWFDDLTPFTIGLCVQQRRLRDPLLTALWRQAGGVEEVA
ncbi:MAG: HTH-type transcriptional activator IlvY [Pseudomonadota bacterium]